MKKACNAENCRLEVSQGSDGMQLHLVGAVNAATAAELMQKLQTEVKDRKPSVIVLDLGQVTSFDDFGAFVLMKLRAMFQATPGAFRLANVSDAISEQLKMLSWDEPVRRLPVQRKIKTGMLVRLGDATLRNASDTKNLIDFVGSACLAFLHVLRRPGSLRKEDVFLCMQKTGVDALPIVGLISFLLGLIMAFMSSVQLKQFGANIYVASLVSLSMARELGPIMTCIIVAGRSGSAFAAEIGTMKVSEEIDALFTMGFDPTLFLAVPRILATVLVVPLLTLFSDVFAIFGGLIVGVGMLDLTAGAYIDQTIKTLTLFDVFWGVFKSCFFGVLIAWIGCLRGFQVRGGAASVGKATTSAVVSGIFLIIVCDALFAVILRYWG